MSPRPLITVMLDDATVPPEDPQFQGNPTEWTTEYHVVTTIRKLGYQTTLLPVADRVEPIVANLTQHRPDLVFNLTEQFKDNRRLDASLAGLLDLLGIPFTGTGPAGLILCRDKGLCKQLLSRHKVRVPGFVSIPRGKEPRIPRALNYPLVVKPVYTDGSEGISNASLVKDINELRDRVRIVHNRWNQPAIVEEYINGRELYVAVIGNKKLSVLPPREMFFKDQSSDGPVLATYKVKWDPDYQKKWKINIGFAKLEPELFKKIARACKKAYKLMRIRDFGRIDIRLKPNGHICILEVNPNPDIAYGDEVAEAAEKLGISYDQLIERIIRLALKRNNN